MRFTHLILAIWPLLAIALPTTESQNNIPIHERDFDSTLMSREETGFRFIKKVYCKGIKGDPKRTATCPQNEPCKYGSYQFRGYWPYNDGTAEACAKVCKCVDPPLNPYA